MKQCLAATGLALATILLASNVLAAAPLRVTYADIVEPDAQLLAFLQTLAAAAQAGIKAQPGPYSAIEAMIAPHLEGFARGLDPLENWHKVDAGDGGLQGLDLLTSSMVETGELPQGAAIPDYRPDFLQLLLALITNPEESLGTMPQTGKAVCSPARYDFDAKAAADFAAANNTDAYGLYIYPRELELHASPQAGTPVTTKIAPRTIVATDYQNDQPDNWTKIVTSDGTTGWIEDRGDYEGLSQQHLCFGKVDGQYKIVGFFSYGL